MRNRPGSSALSWSPRRAAGHRLQGHERDGADDDRLARPVGRASRTSWPAYAERASVKSPSTMCAATGAAVEVHLDRLAVRLRFPHYDHPAGEPKLERVVILVVRGPDREDRGLRRAGEPFAGRVDEEEPPVARRPAVVQPDPIGMVQRRRLDGRDVEPCDGRHRRHATNPVGRQARGSVGPMQARRPDEGGSAGRPVATPSALHEDLRRGSRRPFLSYASGAWTPGRRPVDVERGSCARARASSRARASDRRGRGRRSGASSDATRLGHPTAAVTTRAIEARGDELSFELHMAMEGVELLSHVRSRLACA